MTSSSTPVPFMVRLTKNLPLAEKIFLLTLATGTVLTIVNVDSSVAEVSMIGLSLTFFLYAFRPVDLVRHENEEFQPSQLLALLIAPKVLWISSAISLLGIAFYRIDFGNDGYKRLLMTGGSTIAITLVVLVFLLAGRIRSLKVVAPILLRSIPLLSIDLYILFK